MTTETNSFLPQASFRAAVSLESQLARYQAGKLSRHLPPAGAHTCMATLGRDKFTFTQVSSPALLLAEELLHCDPSKGAMWAEEWSSELWYRFARNPRGIKKAIGGVLVRYGIPANTRTLIFIRDAMSTHESNPVIAIKGAAIFLRSLAQ